jgi:thiamine pyrophosphokinase
MVVGCDGGTDKIHSLNLNPDIVIGDFDSIKKLPKTIKNLPLKDYGKEILVGSTTYIRYSTDKDFLDVEASIDFALAKNLKEIILVNTAGEELDHVLGVVMILVKSKYKSIDIRIVRPKQEVYVVRGKFTINGKKGDKVSLIPIYGSVKVESSSGLKYDPAKYQMTPRRNIGISNELVLATASANISKGCFLVVHHRSNDGTWSPLATPKFHD